MKRTILEGLWCPASDLDGGLFCAGSDLEGLSTIEIPQEKILEVAEAMAPAESEGVQVEWIDLEIGKILRLRDHHHLVRKADHFETG